MDNSTRIIDLTVGELRKLIADTVKETTVIQRTEAAKPVKGLDGIASALGVSRSTANRYKQSGRLDGAVWQVGRTIYCDTTKLQL